MNKPTKQTTKQTTTQIIRDVLQLAKGSGTPGTETKLFITQTQLLEIEARLTNLTGKTQQARLNEILGTCRSMGIKLKHE